MATGVMPFAFVPPELSELPSELASHTSEHSSLEGFRGKDVLVVGGGPRHSRQRRCFTSKGGRQACDPW